MAPLPDPKEPLPPKPAAPAEEADSKKDAPPAANQLTPEEQMARFEAELKETDWGHQPC